jgi:hypothetical protein
VIACLVIIETRGTADPVVSAETVFPRPWRRVDAPSRTMSLCQSCEAATKQVSNSHEHPALAPTEGLHDACSRHRLSAARRQQSIVHWCSALVHGRNNPPTALLAGLYQQARRRRLQMRTSVAFGAFMWAPVPRSDADGCSFVTCVAG